MEFFEKNEKAFEERYGISIDPLQQQYKEELSEGDIKRFSFMNGQIQAVADQVPKDAMFIMIIGFSNGEFVRTLRKQMLPACRLFVWEPDRRFFLFTTQQYDISDLIGDPKIDIFIGEDDGTIESRIKAQLGYFNVDHAFLFCLPGFQDIYGECESILGKIFNEAAFSLRADIATRMHFAEKTCRNMIYAVSVLHNNSTIDQLMKKIPTRDIPVILIASGPSLMKNAHLLKEVEERALIISAAHSYKYLSQNGIPIHFAANLDAFAGDHFMDLDTDNKVHMLLDARCVKPLQEKYNGNIVYDGLDLSIFPFEKIDSAAFEHPSGGSIMTYLFSIFRHNGFQTIILIGQDLAFDKQGFSHANGESEERGKNQESFMVEGIDGRMLRTRDDWKGFLQFYEGEIAAHPETRVIDATEGGAKIHGTEIMTLREAIDTCCGKTYPVRDWIDNLPKLNDGNPEEGRSIMRRLYHNAEKMSRTLNEAIALNVNLQGYWQRGTFYERKHADECVRYDRVYKEILGSEQSNLTLLYSDDIIQEYLNHALTVEGEPDIGEKLEHENRLYRGLLERNMEMKEYIRSLFEILE